MDIQEYLEETIKKWEVVGHPALLERFVLRNGKKYDLQQLAGDLGEPKNCFGNSTHYALERDKKWKYVEGYFWRGGLPLLIHHAWVGQGNKAMDPTLRDVEDGQYFGVEFDTEVMLTETMKNGYYGLLDGAGINWRFMLKIDPGMIEFLPESVKWKINGTS